MKRLDLFGSEILYNMAVPYKFGAFVLLQLDGYFHETKLIDDGALATAAFIFSFYRLKLSPC